MKKFLIFIVIIFSGITNSYATHVMGGDITYSCLGGNLYEVTLTIYRDCRPGAADIQQTTQTVDFSSSCGTFSEPLDFFSVTDVSQLCPTAVSNCSNGPWPGTEQFIFRGTVSLANCPDWIMSWDLCCRNGGNVGNPGIQNLVNPGTQRLYLQTTLNSTAAPCNNSIQFFNPPTPYLCVNQLTIYSHAATDADGDSLFYSLSNPLTTPGPPGVAIPYTPGYSVLQPITTASGITFNGITGEMCFTPTVGEKVVVSIFIQEYRNGILIGSVIRDMQVVVVPGCTNQNPTTTATPSCTVASVLHPTFTGTSVSQIDSNSILMCPDDSVCFDVNFFDNGTDVMYITSNISLAIPTATFTVAGDSTQNPVATLCWKPNVLDSGLHVLSIIARDNACPIVGIQSFVFDITVYDQPYAGPDDTICETETTQLNASGGAGYTWYYVGSTTPIPVGPELSCNPCSNPLATPLITTTYYVESSLTAFCENRDTVTINVIPGYTITSSQSDTNICVGDTINFLTTPSLPGNYTYNWSSTFGAILGNPNDSSTVGTFNFPVTEVITVSVSTASCELVDTFLVNIAPQPIINITTLDTLLNCTDTVPINVSLGAAPSPNNFSFEWNFPTTLNDSTIQNPNANPSQGITDYIVIVTDTLGGCFDTDTVEIRSCCIEQAITANNSSCFEADDGNIIVSATALNSSFVVEFYQNDPVFTLLQTSLLNPADTNIYSLEPGTYTVMIFDTIGCSFSDTFSITEPSPVTIIDVATNATDTSICIDGVATLYATGIGVNGPINLIWNNGAIAGDGPHNVSPWTDSTFTVFAQDINGCVSSTESIDVILRDSIQIDSIYITNATICNGESTIIVANASGGGAGLIYTWYDGNNIILGATDTGAYSVTPNYDGEIFKVIVSDSCTTPPDSITVLTDWANVILPTYSISDSAGCYYDLAFKPIFQNTTPNLSPLDSSTWDFGNGTIYSWPFAIPFEYRYDDPGIYDVTLTVTDRYGCNWDTIMDGIQVHAYDRPQADFLWNPNPTDYLNAQITFNNQSTNNFFNQWLFVTDAQYTSTDINPIFQFPQDQPGNYSVTLITTSEEGCVDSISKIVVIDDVFLFYIPTGFTPDGDGLNDDFKVVGEGLDLSNFKMTVFNKWGELIFESNNPDIGWDGTQNGTIVPNGVYIWKIDAKEAHSPIIHNKDGFINVVR